jgi:hypothetical protein
MLPILMPTPGPAPAQRMCAEKTAKQIKCKDNGKGNKMRKPKT